MIRGIVDCKGMLVGLVSELALICAQLEVQSIVGIPAHRISRRVLEKGRRFLDEYRICVSWASP